MTTTRTTFGVLDAVEWSLGHPWFAIPPSSVLPLVPPSSPVPLRLSRSPSAVPSPPRIEFVTDPRGEIPAPLAPSALPHHRFYSPSCLSLFYPVRFSELRTSPLPLVSRPARGREREREHGTLRRRGGLPWRSIRNLRNSATPCATRSFSLPSHQEQHDATDLVRALVRVRLGVARWRSWRSTRSCDEREIRRGRVRRHRTSRAFLSSRAPRGEVSRRESRGRSGGGREIEERGGSSSRAELRRNSRGAETTPATRTRERGLRGCEAREEERRRKSSSGTSRRGRKGERETGKRKERKREERSIASRRASKRAHASERAGGVGVEASRCRCTI